MQKGNKKYELQPENMGMDDQEERPGRNQEVCIYSNPTCARANNTQHQTHVHASRPPPAPGLWMVTIMAIHSGAVAVRAASLDDFDLV